jgi:hypothetical protein
MDLHYARRDAEALPCAHFDRFRRVFLLNGKREGATLFFGNTATFSNKLTKNDTGRHNGDEKAAREGQKGDVLRLHGWTSPWWCFSLDRATVLWRRQNPKSVTCGCRCSSRRGSDLGRFLIPSQRIFESAGGSISNSSTSSEHGSGLL